MPRQELIERELCKSDVCASAGFASARGGRFARVPQAGGACHGRRALFSIVCKERSRSAGALRSPPARHCNHRLDDAGYIRPRYLSTPAGRCSPRIYLHYLLTSIAEKDNVVKGLAAGADDYLTKPFDPAELLARIGVGRRIIDLHRQIDAKNKLLEEMAHSEPADRVAK